MSILSISTFLDEAVGKDKRNKEIAQSPLGMAFTISRIEGYKSAADTFAMGLDGGPG